MRILYIDVDALRPDHLGCYGYQRNTSPNIDRIAAQGVRYDNYYCSDAPCLPSRTALMTGMFGIHSGVVGHGGTAADVRIDGESRSFNSRLGRENLPALLRKAGLKTISISPFAERHSTWSFYAGFNEMHNTGKHGLESAEEVTPTVLKWIENNADEDNWFLHVNYWDTHTPYRAPQSFGNPFENDPLPEWITNEVFDSHLKKTGPHSANELNMYNDNTNPKYPRYPGKLENTEGLRRMIDGYDCGVSYVDSHIGQIFDAFDKQGILDDMIIIISSDHGENIGELGIYGEHGTADNSTTRIPMIIKWPGYQKGKVDSGLHYHLDLGPTFAEMLKVAPSSSWDGHSFAPSIIKGIDCGRKYLIISQCAHVCQRSVRFGPWFYMRTYHDGYHLFPDEMLYNIEEDPHEQYNMAEEKPEVCIQAVYYLNQWHDNMMKSMKHDVDPLWTVIHEGGPFHAKGYLKEYCERLEATNRADAAMKLKEKYPEEF
jgi:choline-sulfatase